MYSVFPYYRVFLCIVCFHITGCFYVGYSVFPYYRVFLCIVCFHGVCFCHSNALKRISFCILYLLCLN